MRLLITLVIALLGMGSTAQAAFDKGGVLGVGARPTGMGNAFVSIADDSNAVHWNPAGMVQIPRMELSGFFGPLLNGKEYYMSGTFTMPSFEQTAFGLSLLTLYHDTGNAVTRAYENTYIVSFATPMNIEKTVSIGMNLKFLQYDSQASAVIPSTGQTIEAKAGAVGADLGGLYQVMLPAYGKKVNLGFLAQDLDTVLRWQSGVEERVPLMIQTGVAYYPDENLVFSLEYSFFNDTNISGRPLDSTLYDASGNPITTLQPQEHRPHVGLEGWFFNSRLGLRTGYTGFATTADRFTAGVSYKQDWFGVDYGYMGHAEHLGDSHRLSGHANFGGSAERPRAVVLVNPPASINASPRNNSVQLQWEPSSDLHVTGYTIYMSKASGSSYVPIQKRIKENRIVVDGLTNGQRYFFVVTSVNNSWPAVESNYSTEVSCIPSPNIPGAPVLGGGPIGGPMQSNSGVIPVRGWAVPAGSIAGYNLFMSEISGSGYKKVNTDLIKDPVFTVTGLQVDKKYYFRFTQVTTDTPPLESPPSGEWSLQAQPPSQTPPPPNP